MYELNFIDFCDSLEITKYQRERRREELLLWLEEFYEYELIPSKPMRIKILKTLNEYRPLPRKKYDLIARQELTNQKKEDYTTFTIASLGVAYKPNSQSKIAREAIADFGNKKYGHISQERVVRNYIKEPFYEYGESEDNYLWAWYSSYEELSKEELEEWLQILKDNKIDEEAAANAFYKQEQGEDISTEKTYYKMALEVIKERYSDIPVRVKRWKLKELFCFPKEN